MKKYMLLIGIFAFSEIFSMESSDEDYGSNSEDMFYENSEKSSTFDTFSKDVPEKINPDDTVLKQIIECFSLWQNKQIWQACINLKKVPDCDLKNLMHNLLNSHKSEIIKSSALHLIMFFSQIDHPERNNIIEFLKKYAQ